MADISQVEFRSIETDDPPVRYGRRRRIERKLRAYDVIVAGVVVGTVRERMQTFERKTPGRNYVNARWQSPRWIAERLGETRRHWISGEETRKRAVEGLLRDLDRKEEA